VATKLERLKSGGGFHHALWDRIIFNKVRAVFGGRVRLMVSGSAPISGEVLDFMRIAFCCDVLEGYGMTETAAAATGTFPGEIGTAHVGVPNMCVELKLMDVPDMDYLATDLPYPRGEICLRGHNIFKGYYKDPEKTKEALDEEGWLHTGDIGQINSNGTLSIIDRKKNIFKLAQGEYIAPEKIENVYITLPLLAQLYVHGDSLESSLVAVVVPDPEVFVDWARAICGKKTATMEELCRNAVVRKAMLAELTQVGQAAKLQGFEQIKHLHLEPNLFTVENGLLTPTFKAKRDKCAAHYKPIIQELYAELKHQAPKAKL
jgi:long-chain acyl-CoA synthetase